MAYLVYGIVKEPAVVGGSHNRGEGPGDILCHRSWPVRAVSEMSAEEGAPPVSELLIYGRVVEDLHRRQAVVPLRYGCFLNGMESIRKILGERQRQYETLLAELDGRVEMGIRILLPEERADPLPEEQPSDGRTLPILQRKVLYRMREEASRQQRMLVDLYLQTFAGLYDKHRTETAVKSGTVILSLYFLVLRIQVARFRETFGKLAADGKTRSLLSGPWPPYNFVTPDLAPATSKRRALRWKAKPRKQQAATLRDGTNDSTPCSWTRFPRPSS